MFNFLPTRRASKRSRPSSRSSNQKRAAFQARLERLEERAMMSVSPVAVQIPPAPQLGIKLSSAQAVDLQAMPVQQLQGSLASNVAPHFYRVALQQNEFMALDIKPASAPIAAGAALATSNLTILDRAGNKIATAGASADPNTGAISNNAALGFRAATAGTYYVEVGTTAAKGGAYELDIQGAELAQGVQTGDQLQKTGAMDAFLKGNVLDFAGPTGYGFGIRGTWSESVTAVKNTPNLSTVKSIPNLTTATYSATGALFLETAFGELQLAVPDGQTFTVVTKANTWHGAIGEVSSVGANLGIPLDNFALDLRQKLGLTMDSISLGNKFTIQLGSTVTAQRGITQVLNSVPYLVYADKGAMNVQFGGVTVTNKATDGTTILVDPTDPMIYVHVSNYSFAGSLNAHINYTPKFTPSVPVSKIYGNVFASGNFPLDGLPINVQGDITLNLDANHDGLWLAGQENASQLFQHNSINADALDKIFADLQVAVNGEVDFGYDLQGYHLTVPLGQASAVYDGPQQHVWFKGGSVDPWAGTPLENLQMINTVTFEGSVYGRPPVQKPAPISGVGHNQHIDQYFVQAVDTYKILGLTANMTVTLDDEGVSADASVRALGSNVDLTGNIYANGDFSLAGNANVNLGPLSGHADFLLAKTGSNESFTADLSGSAGFSYNGVKASVNLAAKLTISYSASGKISYSGSVSATAKLKTPISSSSVGVSATIENNEIILDIAGFTTVTIALPTV